MDSRFFKIEAKTKEEPLEIIKIKLENEEKQRMEELISEEKEPSTSETTGKDDLELDETSLHECCHCGKKRSSEEMTPTPETHEEFLKWYRFLGENFYENARNSESAMICRSHFDDEFGDSRLINVTCMNNVAETRICSTPKCCYCGKARIKKSLTNVPKEERIFAEWAVILGKDFVENCRKNHHSWICRSHFVIKWDKNRPNGYLPVADLDENSENKDFDGSKRDKKLAHKGYFCISCEEQKRYPELTGVPPDPYDLKLWANILGEGFYKRALLRTKSYICRSHFNVKWNGARPRYILPINGTNFSSEEILDESTTEDISSRYAKDQLICVFCEEWKSLSDMRSVPRDAVTLQRWVEKFGCGFSRRVQSKRRAYICRSHFEDNEGCRKINGLETSHPMKEPLKEDVENNSSSLAKEVPFIQVKMEEPDIDEQLDENLLKCCYCEDQDIIENMALVPRNKKGLTRWMNILGVEFYQNVMKNKHSYICRTHFNEQWKSEKIPDKILPVKNIEKIQEEQKPLHLFSYNVKSEYDNQEILEKIEIQTVIKQELVFVEDRPSDPKRVKHEVKEEPKYMNNQLVKIEPPSLVEQESYDDLRYDKERELEMEKEEKSLAIKENKPDENKPSTSEMGEETNFHECCYCGEKRASGEMASTPDQHSEFLKWYRILGEKFYESAHPSKPSMVCRVHFDDKFGNSRLIDVQCANSVIETKIGNRIKCCYCEKRKLSKYMTHVPKNERMFEEWAKILGDGFIENCRKCSVRFICKTHFGIEWLGSRPKGYLPVADLSANPDDEAPKTSQKKIIYNWSLTKTGQIQYNCISCGELKLFPELTLVTQSPDALKLWGEILGEEFYKMETLIKHAFICKSHFGIKWNKYRPSGILPVNGEHKEKEAEIDNVSKSKSDTGPMMEEVKIEVLDNDLPLSSNVKLEEPDFDEKVEEVLPKCCYCEDQNIIENMALVPRDARRLTRWMNILGVEFYQNVMKNKHSYICRTHFNEQWKSEKIPDKILPVKNIEKVGEEQNLLKCCYCENQDIIENMALVPRDKQGLTRWMNILGVEFYQNVMKNKHSYYICRTHFNEQWKSEKTPKHVVPVIRVEGLVEEYKPLHLLNNHVKSEYENQKTTTQKMVEKGEIQTVIKQEPVLVENGPSDSKRLKLEVKEEPIH